MAEPKTRLTIAVSFMTLVLEIAIRRSQRRKVFNSQLWFARFSRSSTMSMTMNVKFGLRLVAHRCCDPRRATQCRAHSVAAEQCQVVVFIVDDLGFLGPGSRDLMTELCPPQDNA